MRRFDRVHPSINQPLTEQLCCGQVSLTQIKHPCAYKLVLGALYVVLRASTMAIT